MEEEHVPYDTETNNLGSCVKESLESTASRERGVVACLASSDDQNTGDQLGPEEDGKTEIMSVTHSDIGFLILILEYLRDSPAISLAERHSEHTTRSLQEDTARYRVCHRLDRLVVRRSLSLEHDST
jgi:hypothetical protein